jgi:hypothetical protein
MAAAGKGKIRRGWHTVSYSKHFALSFADSVENGKEEFQLTFTAIAIWET